MAIRESTQPPILDLSIRHTFVFPGDKCYTFPPSSEVYTNNKPGRVDYPGGHWDVVPFFDYSDTIILDSHNTFYYNDTIYIFLDNIFYKFDRSMFIEPHHYVTAYDFEPVVDTINNSPIKPVVPNTDKSIFQNEAEIHGWISYNFFYLYDISFILSLHSAWSLVQGTRNLIMEITHAKLDVPSIEIEPIEFHAQIIDNYGKCLYNSNHLPDLFLKHPRDKQRHHRKNYQQRYLYWLGFRQRHLRKSNLDHNYTSIFELLSRRIWLDLYWLFVFPALLFYFVMWGRFITFFMLCININDRNFFGVRVSFVEGLFFFLFFFIFISLFLI